MKDPNNHVPEVAEDDEWDVDADTDHGEPVRNTTEVIRGLPSRKVNGGLPVRHQKASLKTMNVEATEVVDISEEQVGEKEDHEGEDMGSEVLSGKENGTGRGDADTQAELPPAPGNRWSQVVELGVGSKRPTLHVQLAGTLKPKSMADLDADAPKPRKRESARSISRRDRENPEASGWGKAEGRQSAKWLVFAGIGIVGALLLMAVASLRVREKQQTSSDGFGYSEMAAVIEEGAVDTTAKGTFVENLTNRKDEAIEIYSKFATAKTPEEMGTLIWNASAEMPEVEKRFQPVGASSGWSPRRPVNWFVVDKDENPYCTLAGLSEDFEKFSAYFRPEGQALNIDWKATVGFGTATFEELKKGEGDGSEVRAWLSQATFYTFSFPEETYRSFRLSSPDTTETIWVYVQRGTELEKLLLAPFQPSISQSKIPGELQIIVALEPGPEEALPSQWIVKDLVNKGWLTEG